MSHVPRYTLPSHATLRGPHSKADLLMLVERGSLPRGEIVYDQVTKRAHRVGDLIQGLDLSQLRVSRPAYRELEGDAPWAREDESAHELPEEEEEEVEQSEEVFEEEEPQIAFVSREEEVVARGVRSFEDEEIQEEDEDEMEDEEEEEVAGDAAPRVIHHTHPSWWAYSRWLLLSVVCVAAGILAIEQFSLGGVAIGVGLGSLILCCCIIDRQHQDYVVNTERVELVWGIFGRSSKEVRIVDIRSMDVVQSGLLGLIGIGTVEFSSSGTDGVEVHFRDVAKPHKIKELVRRLQKLSGR